VFRNGVWFFRDTTTTGPADHFFLYGQQGDFPIVGEWKSGFVDTPGIVRGNLWILRDADTSGVGDRFFFYGLGIQNGDFPIVGDWNGDGVETAGVVRRGEWILTDSFTDQFPAAQHDFFFGNPTDFPVPYAP
jgi:hypothetical protein